MTFPAEKSTQGNLYDTPTTFKNPYACVNALNLISLKSKISPVTLWFICHHILELENKF